MKHFDRTSNLSGTQIISYRTSADGKWSTLVGIAPGSGEKCVSVTVTLLSAVHDCVAYGIMSCPPCADITHIAPSNSNELGSRTVFHV